jgi:hypothetical protein
MDGAKTYPVPARDPVSGGRLIITEVEGPETGVTIRGRFEMPRFAQLSPDQARYLETFLRCRGMLNSVERELGISYPTARARLDAVLKALDLHAVREDVPPLAPQPPAAPEFEVPRDATEDAASAYDEPLWDTPAEDSDLFETSPAEETVLDEPPYDGELLDVPEPAEPPEPRRSRHEILTLLEKGEITPEEAKKELGVAK